VHILAADDDSISRALLARTLEHWGHKVEAVADGLEACRRLVEPGAPTLAILDWSMPGLEGPEVCRILNLQRALTDRIQELEESRQREHHLRTLTPICSYCKKIRGDKDDWEPIDRYLAEHGYRFTHAVCPSCLDAAAPLATPPRE
jgi:CheY-like chemotaxis protein